MILTLCSIQICKTNGKNDVINVYSNTLQIQYSKTKTSLITKIISYLNISSIRNKFGYLHKIVDENIDILYIPETKLAESFPNNQFVLLGYHLYRLDITGKKSGLMVFVKSHIPSRRLNDFKIPSNIQIQFQ